MKKLLLLNAAAVLAASTAGAAVIAQDDFESYTAGTDDALDFTSGTWTGGQRADFDVVNTGAPASTLVGNYAESKSRATNFGFVNQDAATNPVTIATMSFDFVVPSAVGTAGYFRLSLSGDGTGNGNFRQVDLGGTSNTGSLLEVTMTEDVVHRIDAVMNTTAATISFGGETLAADSIAVYVDGALAYSNTAVNNATFVERVGFWPNPEGSGTVDTFYMDNMLYQDIAVVTGAIPEPSSALLLGLSAFGFFVRRR